MESLETTCEDSERAVKRRKLCHSSVPLFRPQETSDVSECSTSKQSFCIFTKLIEIHQEESAAEPNQTKSGLKTSSHLLEKLIARERLNTLILNLHPGNKGYSLVIPMSTRTAQNSDNTDNMIETVQWPYEDDKFLRFIDNEELPPHLSRILDDFSYLFYSGCVVVEVRDYRQAYPHFVCDIHHVLLRPTLTSITADINNIAEDKDWTNEERQQLESQILLANTPNLCLDPDPQFAADYFQINHNSRMWDTHKFRRTARKYSQVTVNRKRKLDQFTLTPGLELFEAAVRTRTKPKMGTSTIVSSKMPKKNTEEVKPVSALHLDTPLSSSPTQGIAINEFKSLQRPKDSSNCSPQLVEEFVLETDMPSKDKTKPRVYHIKLSILQRPSNLEYLGELYLDRDHKKNEKNGVACRFSLGTKPHAQKYIQQFTDIFTESGRKSVRLKYGFTPGSNKGTTVAQAPAQAQLQVQGSSQQVQLSQYGQIVQNQTCTAPQVNGTVGPGISLIQQPNQNVQGSSNVPILQSQLQRVPQIKSPTQASLSQQREIDAIAANLMSSVQKYQADENAKQQQKQQQQQQQLASSGNNAAIRNLLNSSPASNINSDASAAVVNAINNSSLLSQQVHTINHKLSGRKMTLSNVAGARVLNHSNLIVNNSRINLSDLNSQLGQQQAQTITLTSVNSSGNYTNYTTVPVKQQVVNQRIVSSSNDNKSALSALLVGTPAADRPDIVGPNTNSLLLEKLAGTSSSSQNTQRQQTTHFIQSPKANQQYMVQSPKSNTVMSPLSSPPPQSTNTINVQSLNLGQLQSLLGQVQIPGFAQPISVSLNVSSGNIQGHPASLIVSLPVTTATATSNTVTQTAGNSGNAGNTISVGTPTVVLANAGTSNLAQLVSSGVKGMAQQGGPTSVTLSQGGQSFQLLTPLQGQRLQQAGIQQNITARTLQRTPFTIKMAAPNPNAATLPSPSSLTSQLQKQAQLQQYQQLCLTQQNIAAVAKVRRRSNNSDPQ